ncbi:hypothetical protein HDU76_011900, partial [Blyttiomyces sp. JEL0837]
MSTKSSSVKPTKSIPTPTPPKPDLDSIMEKCPIDETFQEQVITQPHRFLVPDVALAEQSKTVTKWLFDLVKKAEPFEMTPLSELLVDGFDAEQVWEQLQLLNQPMVEYLKDSVEEVIAMGDVPAQGDETDEMDQDEDEDEGEGSDLENPYLDLEAEEGDDDDGDDLEDGGLDLDLDDEDGEMEGDMEDYDFDMDADLEEDMDDDAGLEGASRKRRRGDQDEDEVDEEGDDEDFDDEEEEATDEQERPVGRVTELDDEFFSVEELERFAER